MRMRNLWKFSAAIVTIALCGCADPGHEPGGARFAAASVQERPGLATTFGETRGSRVSASQFRRANPGQPWLLARIHYNDQAGISASGSYAGHILAPIHRLIDFSVRDLRGNQYLIARRSRLFNHPDYDVIGRPGEAYELVIENKSDTQLEIVASVDGLDVLDGKPAAVTKRGYLVEPGKTLVIEGWRTSVRTVAAFRFGAVQDSYAEKKYGETRNVGVIGLAIFNPVGTYPRPFLEQETRRRKKADPFPGGGGFAAPP